MAAEPPARGMERAAVEAARQRVRQPDRFKVLAVHAGAANSLSEDTRFEVATVEGPNASGYVAVTFRTFRGGAPVGERRVSVRGRVYGPAVVAARSLAAGIPIDATAVTIADTDLTRLQAPPLREPQQAFGLVPVRTLGPDRVLTRAMLGPADVVRRGDTVDLVIRRPGMTVRAIGRARRDGAPGEIIPAENTATGAIVMCRVGADGSLVAIRRAGSPRDRRSPGAR